MAKDRISDHFEKKRAKNKIGERAKSALTADEIEAEEELIANAEKVKPIKNTDKVGRNDPCPCGSGKKYKKCHGREN